MFGNHEEQGAKRIPCTLSGSAFWMLGRMPEIVGQPILNSKLRNRWRYAFSFETDQWTEACFDGDVSTMFVSLGALLLADSHKSKKPDEVSSLGLQRCVYRTRSRVCRCGRRLVPPRRATSPALVVARVQGPHDRHGSNCHNAFGSSGLSLRHSGHRVPAEFSTKRSLPCLEVLQACRVWGIRFRVAASTEIDGMWSNWGGVLRSGFCHTCDVSGPRCIRMPRRQCQEPFPVQWTMDVRRRR